ncbi:MAG: bifunctional DNA primase/polymerase, partial [Nitrososphaerota archaeon]
MGREGKGGKKIMFIGHITKIKQNVKAYISSNLSVIPLQANSKQPAVNWKEFQTRKISAQEIDKYEWHNVGIVTGTISSLVVFDADTEAAVSFLRNFEEFRNTATVKTRRGIHYYFIVDDLPQEFGSQKIYKDNIKIDLKANGGYVVAPPSVVDGHEYVWGRENGDGSAQEVLELSF